MKKKRPEKSKLSLGKLLARKRKLDASLEQIAHQYFQLERDKKALNVSEKWFDEREVEVGDTRQIVGAYHLKNIQNSALIRFRGCREQINRWLKENTDLQNMLTHQYWVYQLFSEVDNETYKLISSVLLPQQNVPDADEGIFPYQNGGGNNLTAPDTICRIR